MEKLIQVQDQDGFLLQLRQIVKEELSLLINSYQQNAKQDITFTREEFLKEYNLSSTTLFNRMKESDLPHFRIGRKLYFRKSELDEYFKNDNKN